LGLSQEAFPESPILKPLPLNSAHNFKPLWKELLSAFKTEHFFKKLGSSIRGKRVSLLRRPGVRLQYKKETPLLWKTHLLFGEKIFGNPPRGGGAHLFFYPGEESSLPQPNTVHLREKRRPSKKKLMVGRPQKCFRRRSTSPPLSLSEAERTISLI